MTIVGVGSSPISPLKNLLTNQVPEKAELNNVSSLCIRV